MVMTILEARVAKENWDTLEQAYRAGTQHRDAGIVETFLIHSKKESDLWRILTIWQSQAALDAMRGSGETPRGVLMFRNAKAEPALSVFDINQHVAWE
jgi:heme-degrading monooxygenase HmoA